MFSWKLRKIFLVIGVSSFFLILPNFAMAQKFPVKPIELVVPFAAGGSTDVLCRMAAKFGLKYFDKPLMVVNKPGGSGVIGAEGVVRSKPDGYSLYVGYGSGNDLLLPHLQKMPFDTLKDLSPVCRLSDHSVTLVFRHDAPYKTLKEFLEWAKKRERVTAAIGTKGGTIDLFFQVVGKAVGINFVMIPFRGGAESTTAILGGQTDCGAAHPSEIISHINAKRLIPIATALDTRDPALPDVPTFVEMGYKVPEVTSTKGVGAAKATSPEIIRYISERFKKVCDDPDFIKAMQEIGQPVMYLGPSEFTKFLKNKYDLYGGLVKEFNLTLN